MNRTFYVWAPAPNRHLQSFYECAFRSGALRHVFYGGRVLTWTQLGTRPVSRTASEETYLCDQALDVSASVRQAEWHLIVGFGHRLCRSAAAACAKARIPYFVWGERLSARPWHDPKRHLRDALYRWLLRHASGAMALGPDAARDFVALGVQRTSVIPAIYPGPILEEGRLPTPRSHAVLVYCGRLVEAKGLDLLSTSLRALASDGLDIRLEVVGDGPALESFRSELVGVHARFYGALESDRALDVIRGADVLVLPTRTWEGWGYVVNEALAQGVPVVVSSVVGAREIVARGRTGFVFRDGSTAELAEGIKSALRLHDDANSLSGALLSTRAALDPERFTSYLLRSAESVLDGTSPDCPPPWHSAVENLGGNPEVAWWRLSE